MMDPTKAQAWLKEHIQPYLPQTKITCITVGNEIFAGNDTNLNSNLLPAMKSLHGALVSLGMDSQVNISTAHSLAILSNSYPPSAGSFRPDLAGYIQPLLNFLAQIKSPFLINAYPYFAYKANPNGVSLEYVLFQPNTGMTDPSTNLKYDNMLYAQIDSVYSAIKAMGHTDIEVKISETGWPSKGDSDEAGATLENAGIYNGNLLQRIAEHEGTPMKPSVPIDIYVFALFNEDLKPGPTSERNYGLFYPNGTSVYNIGLREYLPQLSSAYRTVVRNTFIRLCFFFFLFTMLLLAIPLDELPVKCAYAKRLSKINFFLLMKINGSTEPILFLSYSFFQFPLECCSSFLFEEQQIKRFSFFFTIFLFFYCLEHSIFHQ